VDIDVKEQVKVKLSIGNYVDDVLHDVVPMEINNQSQDKANYNNT